MEPQSTRGGGPFLAVVRGGGELGTGVAHALATAGLRVVVLDRPLPTALRLRTSFATAAVEGRITVEGVLAVLCVNPADIVTAWSLGQVPVWTGSEGALGLRADAIVDARMRQLSDPQRILDQARVTIGIGPGFEAGRDVRFVIESLRGPRLGEVLTEGRAQEHTGVPGLLLGLTEERVLRAPCAGRFLRSLTLGAFVEKGDVVGHVEARPVCARIGGMIRGLKLSGVLVEDGHKLGDVDPRRDRALLTTMTDKAGAVGRGALRAIEAAGLLPRAGEP